MKKLPIENSEGLLYIGITESGVIPLACRYGFLPQMTCSWSSVVFAILVCITSIFWAEVEGGEKNRKTTNQAVAEVGAAAYAQLDSLIAKAQAKGQVPVILRLSMGFKTEGNLSGPEVIAQRNAIADAGAAVIQSLAGMNATNVKKYQYVPYLAVTVNATALQALAKNPMVIEISEDVAIPPVLAESTGVVGANAAWGLGYDGSGWAVAVLDTGVDKNHNFLSGKVISEACYSTNGGGSTSLCPGRAASSTATDSGLNCPLSTYGCDHGTHVAGIVAGKDYTPNSPGYNGVANGADIIAIQVFSKFVGVNCTGLGLPSPCALSFSSDQMLGLERVYTLRTTINIAAANMSLGGGQYTSNCDGDSLKASIDNLRIADIATVIASGNSSYTTAMGAPACVSTAISVGATCDSAAAGFGCAVVDDIPDYANIAPFISLLAPGSLISSSTPGVNTFQSWHGTSMAAPHVAGAWALMKQRDPGATVSTILAALQDTGTSIDDQRASGSVTGMRRINVDNALLPQVSAPAFVFPSGGEILHAATMVDVAWNANGAPVSSYYDLAYRDDCTPDVFFSDDMESGSGFWSISHGAGTLDWVLATGNPHSGAGAWFASNPGTVSDQYWSSAGLVTVPANGQLGFWHSYDTEAGYDGGVVEISPDGIVWNDLGPYMTQGGYNSTISVSFDSPIGDRAAFSGNSGGYIETLVDLGSYSGQEVYIRFRMASDSSVSGNGWYVDDVSLVGAVSPWVPIGTTPPGASSLLWSVPLNTGGDYCLSIQGMAPGYTNSPQVITNPFTVSDADSDSDGLGNLYEVTVLGTSPVSVDSDGDGLADGAGDVVPLAALPDGIDVNEDGYVDGEMDYGTDPADADSDNDGVADGDEVSLYGIDPTVSNVGDVGPRGGPDNLVNIGDLVVLTDINSDGQLNVPDMLLLQQAMFSGTTPRFR
jgi:subtilisin family serine protease